MLRVIAETTERVDVFRTRRVRTCLSLSVNKIHPSLHKPTLSASFLPYELCYSLFFVFVLNSTCDAQRATVDSILKMVSIFVSILGLEQYANYDNNDLRY